MDELAFPVAAQPARVAAARTALSTVTVWGTALPLPLRLAAAAAAAELEARSELPYPPAPVPGEDPGLTPTTVAALLSSARKDLLAEIGEAEPTRAVSLAFAARELTDALPGATEW